jgi:hypothetical protein
MSRIAQVIALDISRAEAALASGDVAALSSELAILFPDDPDVDRVGDLVRLALGKPTGELTLSGTAQVFFESIARTRRLLESGQFDQCRQDRMLIGTDMDFIANLKGIEAWTIPQFLNFLTLGLIRPTRRAAVVGTMRNDGIYALEWIAYYLALGFEHIFIYTNDNADGSDTLLRMLSHQKIITLIESETSGKVGPEAKAYEHSIQLLQELREFEWALYVDSDEYFVPAPRFGNSVMNVLAALEEQFPERLPSCVCYAWLWFISEMAYLRTPGFLIERFQHARPHWITKGLVRLQDVVSMRHEHYPDVKVGGFLVDSAFSIISGDVKELWKKRNPQYSGGHLNHYWPKSFEEFALKKARGQTLNLDENLYDRPFEMFFRWNGYGSVDNYYPIDPVMLGRVRETVKKFKGMAGVGAVADQIERGFPALLKHFYDGEEHLRSLYSRHKTEVASL